VLEIISEESLVYHASRNHFSNWLKARTEFWLAHKLRPKQIEDYNSINDLRNDLINSIRTYRKSRQIGVISDFNKEEFDEFVAISRIGGGSIGGKARGLGFMNMMLHNFNIRNKFEGIEIFVPSSLIIGTDIFDEFCQ